FENGDVRALRRDGGRVRALRLTEEFPHTAATIGAYRADFRRRSEIGRKNHFGSVRGPHRPAQLAHAFGDSAPPIHPGFVDVIDPAATTQPRSANRDKNFVTRWREARMLVRTPLHRGGLVTSGVHPHQVAATATVNHGGAVDG